MGQTCTINGKTAKYSDCQGERQTKTCHTGLCRPQVSWVSLSNWSGWTDCVHTGSSTKTRFRICLYMGRTDSEIGDEICSYVHHTEAVENESCDSWSGGTFIDEYAWSFWGNWSQCEAPKCQKGKRTRTKKCLNRSNGEQVFTNNCPGNGFQQEVCDGKCSANVFYETY